MSGSLIELDGAQGEGGGQILRSALTLSLLTGQPFRLRNIRARRPRPGLQPQHLMCVVAAAQIGQAQTRGASLNSSDLEFHPGPVTAGNYRFPIRTAGATGLVLHTLYLPLALQPTPSELILEGGTHVSASPCFHFLDTTWRCYLEKLGLRIDLEMQRAGFYPRGGGVVRARIEPVGQLLGFQGPTPTELSCAHVLSAVADLPEAIAARQAERAKTGLRKLNLEVEVTREIWPGGPGTMCGITLPSPVPTFVFALGARGKPAEAVADEAVALVAGYLAGDGAAVDEHSADQLLLPLAFAQPASQFSVTCVTPHLLTNAEVIHRFLPRRIGIKGEIGAPGQVTME